jgi:predicted Zn-ribbon and HTH transcriptional regulator
MPQCRKCGAVQATVEVRRTTRGWLCKSKLLCKQRVEKAKAAA